MAGKVDKLNQMQPQIHKMKAMIERIGDSHSKQLLQTTVGMRNELGRIRLIPYWMNLPHSRK